MTKSDRRAHSWRAKLVLIAVGVVLNPIVAKETISLSIDHIFSEDLRRSQIPLRIFRPKQAMANFGLVYPYSTLRIRFNRRLTEAQKRKVEYEWRLFKVDEDSLTPLLHLHEADPRLAPLVFQGDGNQALSVSPHGSFNWLDDLSSLNSQLWYTPFGLDGGHIYRFGLPESNDSFDWAIDGGQMEFTTADLQAIDGDLRVLELIVPDGDDWRVVSNPEVVGEADKFYVNASLNDRFGASAPGLNRQKASFYPNIKMKIRGNTSLFNPFKRFTLNFDKDQRFEGFKEPRFQGKRDKIVLISGMLNLQGLYQLVPNFMGFKTMREMERLVYAGALSSDVYPTLVVLNGVAWGIYLACEFVEAGKETTLQTRDRREVFDFGKNTIVHAIDDPLIASDFLAIEPKTDFTIKESERVEGFEVMRNQTQVEISLPHPLVQTARDEIEFELQARRPSDASKISFSPIYEVINESGESVRNPNIVYDKVGKKIVSIPLGLDGQGDQLGLLSQLDTDNPQVFIDLPFVALDDSVEVEFRTGADWLQFMQQWSLYPSRLFDVFHLPSKFLHMIFYKWADGRDNLNRNLYIVQKNDSVNSLRNLASPYFFMLWDCDDCFFGPSRRDTPFGEVFDPFHYVRGSDPLKVLLEDSATWPADRDIAGEYRQVYDMLAPVFERSFYHDHLQSFYNQLAQIEYDVEEIPSNPQVFLGHLIELHAARWDDPFPRGPIKNFMRLHIDPKIENIGWREDYVGRLVEKERFIRGDVNGNGERSIVDAISLGGFLQGQTESCPNLDACDVNDDGEISLTDMLTLLNYLFLRGDAPAHPTYYAEFDQTVDDL